MSIRLYSPVMGKVGSCTGFFLFRPTYKKGRKRGSVLFYFLCRVCSRSSSRPSSSSVSSSRISHILHKIASRLFISLSLFPVQPDQEFVYRFNCLQTCPFQCPLHFPQPQFPFHIFSPVYFFVLLPRLRRDIICLPYIAPTALPVLYHNTPPESILSLQT